MEKVIAITGATISIIIAILGAFLTYYYNVKLKLKNNKIETYSKYISAINEYSIALNNNNNLEAKENYCLCRNKLFIFANCKIINKMINFEDNCLGKSEPNFNIYLTDLLKEIRTDLNIKNNNFPLFKMLS